MRKLIALLLCCLLPVGCLSTVDVGDCIYVLSFGIERGETYAYRIVLLAALPEAGSEEGATLKTEVLSAEARTLFEAIETLNAGLPLTLRFSRTGLILLSEPLAREGALKEILDFSLGALDISWNVRIMVASGALSELYEGVQSDADPAFSKTMKNIERLAEQSGTIVDNHCRTVRESFGTDTFDLVLPYLCSAQEPEQDAVGGEVYPKIGGALVQKSLLETSLIGSAVFYGDTMCGTLSGRHTQLVGMVTGEFCTGRMPFYHPDHGMLSVQLTARRSPRIRFDQMRASVTVTLDAETEFPLLKTEGDETLTDWLRTRLEAELSETFATLQSLGSDAMQLGTRDVLRRPLERERDWKPQYEQLSVSFSVNLRLLHAGGTA